MGNQRTLFKRFLSMKLEKYRLIAFAGFVWFCVGLLLLIKGLMITIFAAHLSGQKAGPIMNFLMHLFTGAIIPTILTVVLLGMLLGFFKGKWALSKAAQKTVRRIYPMRGPQPISRLYRLHDYLLIIAMIGLGRLMNWAHVPNDLHALFDLSIGSALINGAMIYFRYAIKFKEAPS